MISPLYVSDLSENLPATTIIVASCDRMKRDSYALKRKLGDLATLFVLPGTHAFLTARALFDPEPGPDPIVLTAAAINVTLNPSLSQSSAYLSDLQNCIEVEFPTPDFKP